MPLMPYEILALKLGVRLTHSPILLYQVDHRHQQDAFFYSWWVQGPLGAVLIDPGFSAADAAEKDVGEFVSSPKALDAAGVKSERVEHIILTHLHWDHFGSVDAYPNATFYLQDRELRHFQGPLSRRSAYSKALPSRDEVNQVIGDGRLKIIEGDVEIVPGVQTMLVGGHSPGLQLVVVDTESGPAVICSDAANLYRNVEEDIPPGVLADMDSALLALDRIKELAASPRHILPSHDPLVMNTLEDVGPGVARLR
jgi:glyoxylase-like metal-dependent hydrolase (beta-lactamase superfamily II)